MDTDILVEEQLKAGTWFLSEFQKYCPVQAAFWIKKDEERPWYLYVASVQITDENFDLAYGEIIRIAAQGKNPWFDPFRVKVVGMDHHFAKAVAELQGRFPIQTPTHFPPQMLTGPSVDGLYIYPPPIAAAA